MSNEGLNLPEIELDLSGDDVRAWGGTSGPILPIGVYTFDVAAAEQSTSKKNQPVVKVTFKVADEGEFLGVEMTKSYSLQPQAVGRFKNLMMAAGCRLDKIRLGELAGSRIIAEIIHVPGQPTVDAQGNVTESNAVFCDVIKEQGIEQVEAAPPPPPPATKGKDKAAAAATAGTAQGKAPNGAVARRA